ncbi:MAG: hypothetical protein HC804_13685 [Anaerolineae bacterium]|nr:hypothetical protein [Anaerolineae bacterium]
MATQDVTDRGYTGHKENLDIGLIYMNARYYVPNTNRMLTPDTIVPNPANPQSFNRYSYVRNNPVNFTDPTGHRECGRDCNEPLPSQSPTEDLTSWLVSEMVSHAEAPELALMRLIVNLPRYHLPTNGPTLFPGYTASAVYISQLAGPFYQLNKGFGRWDVKRRIEDEIGPAVILCGSSSCDWFDYSTPGNILYGFTAASVGIPVKVSEWAGGALEIKEGTVDWSNWQTSFEDPQDLAAVQFGNYLFETYGPDITVAEFQEAFTVDVQMQLQKPPSGFTPRNLAAPGQGGYPVGYFDYVEE